MTVAGVWRVPTSAHAQAGRARREPLAGASCVVMEPDRRRRGGPIGWSEPGFALALVCAACTTRDVDDVESLTSSVHQLVSTGPVVIPADAGAAKALRSTSTTAASSRSCRSVRSSAISIGSTLCGATRHGDRAGTGPTRCSASASSAARCASRSGARRRRVSRCAVRRRGSADVPLVLRIPAWRTRAADLARSRRRSRADPVPRVGPLRRSRCRGISQRRERAGHHQCCCAMPSCRATASNCRSTCPAIRN